MFCGGLPLTREHVYPQWLQNFSGPQSFIDREGGYQKSVPQTVARKNSLGEYVEILATRGKKAPNLHEVTVKAVCAACNNGWMSALEGQVLPTLKKLANHDKLVLDRNLKNLLAAWAHKCFLMYDLYQDSRDRIFIDEDFISFKRSQKPPPTARLYMGFSNSPYTTISLWHEPRLFIPAGFGTNPQSVLGSNNLSSSSLGVQGIYFLEQYFRPEIKWNAFQRRAIALQSQAIVEGTPAQQIWPSDNKGIRWPPTLTSHRQFEAARLALHGVLGNLPSAIERVDSLE